MNLYEEIQELVEKAREEGLPDLIIQDTLASIHLEIMNRVYLEKHYGKGEVPPRLSVERINGGT